MPQVYVPGGEYRLHQGPVEMAHNRIANRFGIRGLAGEGDARGPSRVLPMVRGQDGWFYLSDGKRAQGRVRKRTGMGDAAADYLSQAQSYTPGSATYNFLTGCVANPSSPACAAQVSSVLSAPALSASQEAQVRAAQATGAAPPVFQPMGLAPTVAQLTPQEAASAATGQPNQNVPPRDTSTPMPTGTGSGGGNPLCGGDFFSCPTASSGIPLLSSGILLVAGLGLLLFMGK